MDPIKDSPFLETKEEGIRELVVGTTRVEVVAVIIGRAGTLVVVAGVTLRESTTLTLVVGTGGDPTTSFSKSTTWMLAARAGGGVG